MCLAACTLATRSPCACRSCTACRCCHSPLQRARVAAHALPSARVVPVQRRYEIRFDEVRITKPGITEANDGAVTQLYPAEARLRNLTYESQLLIDVQKSVFNKETDLPEGPSIVSQHSFGSIPIMVQSAFCRLRDISDKDKTRHGECTFDQGGYFIVNGSEKVLIAQERQAYNRVYCFHIRAPAIHSWKAEIRSQVGQENKPRSAASAKMLRTKGGKGSSGVYGRVDVGLPRIAELVESVVVFRALGFQSDRQVLSHVVYDLTDSDMVEAYRPSLEAARAITTTEGARDRIGRRGLATTGASPPERKARVEYAAELLRKEFLPHLGKDDGSASMRTRKGFFLGYIIHRLLLCAVGRNEEDDRDHFANKRLDLAGPLIGGLFRQLFYNLTKAMRVQLQQTVDRGVEPNVGASIKSDTITKGLRYCLATGNWGVAGQTAAAPKTGVSQVLNRLTYASSLSHLRRANTPLGSEGKQAKPRQLHNTQWGMICPCETPEGGSIGLVKNLALMAYISVRVHVR
ncbi:hypothetical protein EON62_03665, partial [archaeon]